MRYVSSSGSLPIDYKNGNRETIEGVGWNFILRIQFTADVGYYSVGGPNHSKTLYLLFKSDQKHSFSLPHHTLEVRITTLVHIYTNIL